MRGIPAPSEPWIPDRQVGFLPAGRLRPLLSEKALEDPPRDFSRSGASDHYGALVFLGAITWGGSALCRTLAHSGVYSWVAISDRPPFLALKVTRVRRGDFFPSRNETRLAPADLGALNFTRTRRGSFLHSRTETVSLRFASISTPSSMMKAKRPLNPVQAKHYPPPADGHLHGAHH